VAARSIPGFMKMLGRVAEIAPLGRNVAQDEVGNLGLFLLSPLAAGITGETVYVLRRCRLPRHGHGAGVGPHACLS
jgi:enoyl-[acyl-carrier protein] reductase I